MALVGFRAQNHRQQVAARGPRPEVDNLETPWEFFMPLQERFRFTLDDDEERAKAAAINEALEGEQAREELIEEEDAS